MTVNLPLSGTVEYCVSIEVFNSSDPLTWSINWSMVVDCMDGA